VVVEMRMLFGRGALEKGGGENCALR